MVAVPFPLLSAPGKHPQAAGGRLINCYPEKLAATAGKEYAYWRAPGLKSWGATGVTNFRGRLLVGSTLYAVVGNRVFSFTSAGGAGTQLTGTVSGTVPVFMARDNATTPNIVIVSPGDGAQIISAGAVTSYPGTTVGQPNSVKYHKGVFNFTYGDGTIRNSDVNALNINSLSQAAAESKPDTLYCSMPLGNGQILQVGSASMEVWGGQNDTGYFFSYIATIARGVVGPYAIAGDEDGWGKGIFLVGDDYRVSRLDGYTPVPISTPELEKLIRLEADKSAITVSVHAVGSGFVAVQGANWCWVFDTTINTWFERQSYLRQDWRGLFPVQAFGKWLCGDKLTGNLLEIDAETQDEVGNPLRMRIETGPMGAFPSPVRVNGIELYCTKGVGIATGNDPVQTDPSVEISVSRNGGMNWSNPRAIKVGRQALTDQRVRSAIWGQAEVQGVRWRFDETSNVPFAFMGADMQVDGLR
ncbi:hypothetical protein [Bradyrhizobium sp. Leo121]|uniref:hypothetical protein n=1 Tax=Bradyrhizobium sp. Leo121 TaxID=1571195 RepID=UPI001028D23B|nr:hypothetical protein [Bradyrhizobium sp. Leo121]RZN21932.1 hypothetical protein CWO90_32470 [Bradyrhizobium sp. Leo121]